MSKDTISKELRSAIKAAQDKKAAAITLLDLTGLAAFTGAFLLCTGFSTPQVEAICDAIEEELRPMGLRPVHREGRAGSEWVLLDYGSFIVHAFTERVRHFYDIERLWRMARRVDFAEPSDPAEAADGTRG